MAKKHLKGNKGGHNINVSTHFSNSLYLFGSLKISCVTKFPTNEFII